MTRWITSSRFGFLFLLFRSELYASGSTKGVFPYLNPLTYVDVCWRMLFVQTRDTLRPRAWHIMQWQRLRNTLLKKFRFATFHLIRKVSSKNCLVLSIKVLKQSNVTESLFLTLLNSELWLVLTLSMVMALREITKYFVECQWRFRFSTCFYFKG